MTDEVIETEVETTQEPEKFDGLSNRDALAKAMEKHAEPERETPADDGAPTVREVKKEISEEIEPPSEFSAAGKKAWKEKDFAGVQREYRRVHDARTQELSRQQSETRKYREEAEKERKEASTWRELGKRAAPYIEARGKEGVTPDQAIIEALRLIDAFKQSDPATAKAELKAIGIDLDAPGGKQSSASGLPDELLQKITGLQKDVESFKQEKEAQHFQTVAASFDTVFTKMGAEQNRVGESVYPDLHDGSPEGIEFAKTVGSFAFHPKFQAGVLRRFPDADFERVVREAYTAAGGRVSGEAAKVSESNQAKIDKSRRAAASTPGRVAPHKDSSTLKGKLGNRAALIQALSDHQEH